MEPDTELDTEIAALIALTDRLHVEGFVPLEEVKAEVRSILARRKDR